MEGQMEREHFQINMITTVLKQPQYEKETAKINYLNAYNRSSRNSFLFFKEILQR